MLVILTTLFSTARGGKVIMNSESVRHRNGVVVADLKVLSRNSPRDTEEIRVKPQSQASPLQL